MELRHRVDTALVAEHPLLCPAGHPAAVLGRSAPPHSLPFGKHASLRYVCGRGFADGVFSSVQFANLETGDDSADVENALA